MKVSNDDIFDHDAYPQYKYPVMSKEYDDEEIKRKLDYQMGIFNPIESISTCLIFEKTWDENITVRNISLDGIL